MISPNRFGPNTFTVRVINAQTEQTVINVGVFAYTTMLDIDMGTGSINLQPYERGAFQAIGDLGMAGNWQVQVVVRTLDNTLHPAVIRLLTPA